VKAYICLELKYIILNKLYLLIAHFESLAFLIRYITHRGSHWDQLLTRICVLVFTDVFNCVNRENKTGNVLCYTFVYSAHIYISPLHMKQHHHTYDT